MITNDAVGRFLAGHRIAVVGASDRRDSFGGTICRALDEHGYEVVPVHPDGGSIGTLRCHPSLTDIPGPVDGVVVMVPAPAAASVVEEAAAMGIDQVWLFKGVGGTGSVSDDALAACERHHIEPIAGACPLMFLEPAAAVHRIHRVVRRARGDVERAGVGR
jgi:predicted CoA-binding protein